MIKQTLFFTTPVSLSLRLRQLVIGVGEGESETKVTRPIEDLGCVVLENPLIRVTLPLLNALVEEGVAVILCDRHGMPSALLQPLEANATQAETIRAQVAASQPTQKQAWRQLIEAKILGQAALLDRVGGRGDLLRPLARSVRSGDPDNREGAAARIYWKQLFGDDFQRERQGAPPNQLLNYGYAILRAAVARALLGSGLLPQFGLFHHNRYNAFPLADDVMEPYRPYVDQVVYRLYKGGCMQLDKDTKVELLRVLTCDVHMDAGTRPLQVALSFTTASLARLLTGEDKHLVLPTHLP